MGVQTLKIRTDIDGVITAYAIVGGLGADQIEVPDERVPENFDKEYLPEKFSYVENKIIKNPDFIQTIDYDN